MALKTIPTIANYQQLVNYMQVWRAGLKRTIKGAPTARIPFNFASKPTRGHVQLTWSSVKEADGYQILRNPTPDFANVSAVKYTITDPKQTTFLDNVAVFITSIVTIARAANVVTVTLNTSSTQPDQYDVGKFVNIINVNDSSFDGQFAITGISGGTFTYNQTGANAMSNNGQALPTFFYQIRSLAGTTNAPNSVTGLETGTISGYPLDPADGATNPATTFDTTTTDKSQTKTQRGNYKTFGET
jgi:hypothetical protein